MVLLALSRQWNAFTDAFKNRGLLKTLLVSSILISGNWLMYVWAVNNNHILDASFGYYINPLLSVLLANIFLRENLTRTQWFSVACIAVAVTCIGFDRGEFPVIALFLAGTFAVYGLIRKQTPVGALVGLTIESLFASVVALVYLVYGMDKGAFGPFNAEDWLLLYGTGALTALPLIWFAMGARQLSLATMGILQYISPTCMFIIAVVKKGQSPSALTLASFAFIWLAIVLFTAEALRKARALSR